MNISFYKGKKGTGFWCMGDLKGIDRIVISVKNRFGDRIWASVIDDPEKGIVFKAMPKNTQHYSTKEEK